MNKVYADLAVMQQPAVSGIAPLSAAPQGIGAFGLPVSWLMGAVGTKRPRNADLGLIQAKCAVVSVAPTATKPGDMPVQAGTVYASTVHASTVHASTADDNYMTRTVANSDGGSGPHPPLRERPPA